MLISYNWLQDYLGEALPSVEAVVEAFTLHAFEIEEVTTVGDDTVIDVDVLPNRSSDCLSHRGLARELATILNVSLQYDPLKTAIQLPSTTALTVAIDNTEKCPRFTASVLENVTIKPSPSWLQERLQAIGQRPINNVVDATNYIMYALGQPLHAYDADTFPTSAGTWKFGVRDAAPGETISLLAEGGKDELRELQLDGTELLITEQESDTAVGLAGVKGGQYAGVDDTTTRIIIEAAHFDAALTRRTARRHGIVIDASKRFENEPSRTLPPLAQQAIADLLADIAGAKCVGYLDEYPQPTQNPRVEVSVPHANSLLGLQLEAAVMADILKRTGCQVDIDGEQLSCVGPAERTDLNIAEDFIEEIGRLYGYSKIATIPPTPDTEVTINTKHYYSEQIRNSLVAAGCSEVITSSFRKKDKIKLQNALASDKGYLRSTLIKNLHEALDKNSHHQDLLGISAVRIFEIGTVFTKTENGVDEATHLAIGVRLRSAGYSGKEDALLQELTTAVEETLGITIDWQIQKGVAECNISELLETLPTPDNYEPVTPAAGCAYQPFSHYPAVSRDIAMWVPAEVVAETVAEVLDAAAGSLRVRTTHLDTFEKDGRISYAFRLVFQAPDRTLTDEEVNQHMEAVYQAATAAGYETR